MSDEITSGTIISGRLPTPMESKLLAERDALAARLAAVEPIATAATDYAEAVRRYRNVGGVMWFTVRNMRLDALLAATAQDGDKS